MGCLKLERNTLLRIAHTSNSERSGEVKYCTGTYKYKYNGKELQDELGLNLYDYGMRNYDPAIGRWMNIDPLAEKYPGVSPYAFCLNNPVLFIDPNGMEVVEHDDRTTYTSADAQNLFKTLQAQSKGSNTSGEEKSADTGASGPGDPPKKEKSGVIKQFLLAVPVFGPTMDSGDKLAEGDYWGSASSFGIGLLDLFTLGAANDYKVGTDAVVATAEKATEKTAIEASNGLKINGFVKHSLNRAIGDFVRKGVKPNAILDALKNPLVVKDAITDGLGRQSQRFIGRLGEVVVNPGTGKIISVNPTSASKVAKLLK